MINNIILLIGGILITIILIIIYIDSIYYYVEYKEHLVQSDTSYSNCEVGCMIACKKKDSLWDPSCYTKDSDCYKVFTECYKICVEDCVII